MYVKIRKLSWMKENCSLEHGGSYFPKRDSHLYDDAFASFIPEMFSLCGTEVHVTTRKSGYSSVKVCKHNGERFDIDDWMVENYAS